MKNKVDYILFSEPNVFSILPEWPDQANFDIDCNLTQQDQCEKKSEFRGARSMCRCAAKEFDFNAACEQSKANAIRIENPLLVVECNSNYAPEGIAYFYNGKVLKSGDIFHVEGFEYEVNKNARFADGLKRIIEMDIVMNIQMKARTISIRISFSNHQISAF
jgi:hypothetical protein